MNRSFLPYLVFLPLTVCGCHGGPKLHVTSATPPALESGWTLAESRDKQVSIGVPSGWRFGADTVGSSIAGMAGNLGGSSADQMGSSDSQVPADVQNLANQMAAQDKAQEEQALAELEKKGVLINVINGSKPIPGERRTRFYVLKTHVGGTVSQADAEELEKSHFAHKPKPTHVTLPIGPASRLASDVTMVDGGNLHEISYVVVDGEDVYTLRFVTEEDAQTIQSVDEQVVNTLRIKPSAG